MRREGLLGARGGRGYWGHEEGGATEGMRREGLLGAGLLGA